MIDFLSRNWFWILFLGSMIFMHVGHFRGGHGGHGAGHAGHAGHGEHGTVAGGRASTGSAPSNGGPAPAGRDAG